MSFIPIIPIPMITIITSFMLVINRKGIITISIIILLFVINLRPIITNEETNLNILFVIDTIVSTSIISKIKNANFKPYKDNTEEITHKIKEYLKDTSKLTKRLYEAFPNVKSTLKNTKEKIDELKEKNKKEKEELDEELEYQTDEIINEEKENNK